MESGTVSVQVSVRVRPLNTRELESGTESALTVDSNTIVVTKNPDDDDSGPPSARGSRLSSGPDRHSNAQTVSSRLKRGPAIARRPAGSSSNPLRKTALSDFTYDHVFQETSTNEEIYLAAAKPIIMSCAEGFNVTMFAYGQTSSGKTHTMLGVPDDPGIITQSIRDLYKFFVQRRKERDFTVRVSYMEIYNEVITDLLDPSRTNLKVHEDPNKGIYVGDLKEELVMDSRQVLQLLRMGQEKRHVAATNMNAHSSRSHTLFRLVVESMAVTAGGTAREGNSIRVSQLNLVDLAGSERARSTGAEGQRLKEGSHINKSLLTLGNVIRKLSDGKTGAGVIPYRDSKLTRILQNALGGNSKAAVICTVTPAATHVEETKSTLLFASRAKRIVNKVKVNRIEDEKQLIKRLRFDIMEMKKKFIIQTWKRAMDLAAHQRHDHAAVKLLRSNSFVGKGSSAVSSPEHEAFRRVKDLLKELVATSTGRMKQQQVQLGLVQPSDSLASSIVPSAQASPRHVSFDPAFTASIASMSASLSTAALPVIASPGGASDGAGDDGDADDADDDDDDEEDDTTPEFVLEEKHVKGLVVRYRRVLEREMVFLAAACTKANELNRTSGSLAEARTAAEKARLEAHDMSATVAEIKAERDGLAKDLDTVTKDRDNLVQFVHACLVKARPDAGTEAYDPHRAPSYMKLLDRAIVDGAKTIQSQTAALEDRDRQIQTQAAEQRKLRDELGAANHELDALRRKVADLEASLAASSASLESESATRKRVEADREELTDEKDSLARAVADACGRVADAHISVGLGPLQAGPAAGHGPGKLLDHTVAENESRLRTLAGELDALRSSLQGTRAEMSSKDSEAVAQLQALRAQLNDAESALRSARKDLDDARRDGAAFEDSAAKLRAERDALSRAATAASSSLNNQVLQSGTAGASFSPDGSATLAERLASSAGVAVGALQELARARDELKTRTAQTEAESQRLQFAVERLEGDLSSARQTGERVENEKTVAERQQRDYKDQASRLESQLADAERRCSTLDDQLQAARDDAASLRQQLAALGAECDRLVAAAHDSAQLLAARGGGSTAALSGPRQSSPGAACEQLSSATSEFLIYSSSLSDELESLRTASAGHQKRADRLQADLDDAVKARTALEKQSQDDAERAAQALEQAHAELDELRASTDRARSLRDSLLRAATTFVSAGRSKLASLGVDSLGDDHSAAALAGGEASLVPGQSPVKQQQRISLVIAQVEQVSQACFGCMDDLYAAAARTESALKHTEGDLTAKGDALDRTRTELDQLRETLRSRESSASAVAEEVAFLEQQAATLRGQLDALAAEKTRLQRALDEARAERDALETGVRRSLRSLEETAPGAAPASPGMAVAALVAALDSSATSAVDAQRTARRSLSEQESMVAQGKREADRLRAEIETLSQSVAAKDAELGAAAESQAKAARENTELSSQLHAAQLEASRHEQRAQELQASQADTARRLEEARSDQAELDKDLSRHRHALQTVTQTLRRAGGSGGGSPVREAGDVIQQSTTASTDVADTVEELREELRALKMELQAVQQDRDSALRAIEQARAEAASERARVEAALTEAQVSRDSVSDLLTETAGERDALFKTLMTSTSTLRAKLAQVQWYASPPVGVGADRQQLGRYADAAWQFEVQFGQAISFMDMTQMERDTLMDAVNAVRGERDVAQGELDAARDASDEWQRACEQLQSGVSAANKTLREMIGSPVTSDASAALGGGGGSDASIDRLAGLLSDVAVMLDALQRGSSELQDALDLAQSQLRQQREAAERDLARSKEAVADLEMQLAATSQEGDKRAEQIASAQAQHAESRALRDALLKALTGATSQIKVKMYELQSSATTSSPLRIASRQSSQVRDPTASTSSWGESSSLQWHYQSVTTFEQQLANLFEALQTLCEERDASARDAIEAQQALRRAEAQAQALNASLDESSSALANDQNALEAYRRVVEEAAMAASQLLSDGVVDAAQLRSSEGVKNVLQRCAQDIEHLRGEVARYMAAGADAEARHAQALARADETVTSLQRDLAAVQNEVAGLRETCQLADGDIEELSVARDRATAARDVLLQSAASAASLLKMTLFDTGHVTGVLSESPERKSTGGKVALARYEETAQALDKQVAEALAMINALAADVAAGRGLPDRVVELEAEVERLRQEAAAAALDPARKRVYEAVAACVAEMRERVCGDSPLPGDTATAAAQYATGLVGAVREAVVELDSLRAENRQLTDALAALRARPAEPVTDDAELRRLAEQIARAEQAAAAADQARASAEQERDATMRVVQTANAVLRVALVSDSGAPTPLPGKGEACAMLERQAGAVAEAIDAARTDALSMQALLDDAKRAQQRAEADNEQLRSTLKDSSRVASEQRSGRQHLHVVVRHAVEQLQSSLASVAVLSPESSFDMDWDGDAAAAVNVSGSAEDQRGSDASLLQAAVSDVHRRLEALHHRNRALQSRATVGEKQVESLRSQVDALERARRDLQLTFESRTGSAMDEAQTLQTELLQTRSRLQSVREVRDSLMRVVTSGVEVLRTHLGEHLGMSMVAGLSETAGGSPGSMRDDVSVVSMTSTPSSQRFTATVHEFEQLLHRVRSDGAQIARQLETLTVELQNRTGDLDGALSRQALFEHAVVSGTELLMSSSLADGSDAMDQADLAVSSAGGSAGNSERQLERFRRALAGASRRIESLRADRQRLTRELSDATSTVEELRPVERILASAAGMLRSKVFELSEALGRPSATSVTDASFESVLSVCMSLSDAAGRELRSARHRLQELQESTQNARSERELLAEQEAEDLRLSLGLAKTRCEVLERDLDEVRSRLETANARLAEAEPDLREQISETVRLRELVDTLERERDALRVRAEDVEAQVEARSALRQVQLQFEQSQLNNRVLQDELDSLRRRAHEVADLHERVDELVKVLSASTELLRQQAGVTVAPGTPGTGDSQLVVNRFQSALANCVAKLHQRQREVSSLRRRIEEARSDVQSQMMTADARVHKLEQEKASLRSQLEGSIGQLDSLSVELNRLRR